MSQHDATIKAKRLATALERPVYVVYYENAWQVVNYPPQASFRGEFVEVTGS